MTTKQASNYPDVINADLVRLHELWRAFQDAKQDAARRGIDGGMSPKAIRCQEAYWRFHDRHQEAADHGTRHPAVTHESHGVSWRRPATRTKGEIGYLLEMYRTAPRSERKARWADAIAWVDGTDGWCADRDDTAIYRKSHTGSRGKVYWQRLRRDSWTWTLPS